ncbi:ANTAR domain-containing protein [Geodermatophilus sp. SYSU D01045]
MRARSVTLQVAVHARQATVTGPAGLRRRLAAAERHAADLEVAPVSNRRIGQAIGILVARHGVTEDQAFDLLRQCSNRHDVELAVVADDVARTGELQPTARGR